MFETVFACIMAMLSVFGAYCMVRLLISELVSPFSTAIEICDSDDAESIFERIGEASLRFPEGRICLLVNENSPARELLRTLDIGSRVKIFIIKDPAEEKSGGERQSRQ